jgi:hypothetical protein
MTLVTTAPCRLIEKSEHVYSSERAASVIATVYTLLLPTSTSIGERDQVLVSGVTFTVTALLQRNARSPYHKSATLEKGG